MDVTLVHTYKFACPAAICEGPTTSGRAAARACALVVPTMSLVSLSAGSRAAGCVPVSTAKAVGVLRLVLHDAGTFNLGTKQGGMNGSIIYELERPESTGLKRAVRGLEKVKNALEPACAGMYMAIHGLRGREGLGFSSALRPGNCALWGIVHKRKEQGSRLNCARSQQPSCALETSGSSVGGNDGGARKEFRMPVLDKDANGNFFFRDFSGDENLQPRENGSSSSSKPSRPARKINSAREAKVVNGKSSSPGPLRSVKVNLPPSVDPRARRLASSSRAAGNSNDKGMPLHSKAARRFYNEKFRAEPQRLSKVLAAAGVASRRGCEEVIFEGRVSVNGDVCKVPQTPVDLLKDIIYVDGHSLPKKMAPKLYFALNKPKGYICSTGEEGTKPVLALFDDYLKIWGQRNPGLAKPRMFTVGRLDVATSGLLLITNDGDFAQKVSHPSSGLTKEYVATVKERVTRRQLQTIASGTMVQGVQCVPKEVELLDLEAGEERQRLRIVVGEGRNHEVRHLVENSGLQVLGLKRTRIGGLRLSRKLAIGKFDTLSATKIAEVLNKNV